MPTLQPQQPLECIDGGVVRFRRNRLVEAVLAAAGSHDTVLNLNEIAIDVQAGKYSVEDYIQFNQLLGWSVSGFADVAAGWDGTDSAQAWQHAVEQASVAAAVLLGAEGVTAVEAPAPGEDLVPPEQLIRARCLDMAVGFTDRIAGLRDPEVPHAERVEQVVAAAAAFERYIVSGVTS